MHSNILDKQTAVAILLFLWFNEYGGAEMKWTEYSWRSAHWLRAEDSGAVDVYIIIMDTHSKQYISLQDGYLCISFVFLHTAYTICHNRVSSSVYSIQMHKKTIDSYHRYKNAINKKYQILYSLISIFIWSNNYKYRLNCNLQAF